MIRVWDALVRSLHWLLAASVATAWSSGHWMTLWTEAFHHAAGYMAAGVVAARMVWGFAGGRYSKFYSRRRESQRGVANRLGRQPTIICGTRRGRGRRRRAKTNRS